MNEKTNTDLPLLLPQPGARRRGGRPRLDVDARADARIGVACTRSELLRVREAAQTVGMSVSEFLLAAGLDRRIEPPKVNEDARQLWSSTSRLQSDFNQLVARMNEQRLAGDSPDQQLLTQLLAVYEPLHALLVDLRLSFVAGAKDGGRRR